MRQPMRRSRPKRSNEQNTTVRKNSMPWFKLFQRYGIGNLCPVKPFPETSGWAEILDWVSNEEYIIPEQEELALDIWCGKVNPLVPVEEPVATQKPTKVEDQTPSPSASAPKKTGSPIKKKRLSKRTSKPKENDTSPQGSFSL